jgi:hypothetical protein
MFFVEATERISGEFNFALYRLLSRDNSVGIATGYGLDGWGSILGRSKIFSVFSVSGLSLGPTQPPVQWELGALSAQVKLPGREADHSPTFSAENKNDGAIPPLPMRLHGLVHN